MTALLLVRRVPIGLGLVRMLEGTGCATSSDLGKLKKGLTQKLEVLDNALQAQVENLRAALQTTQTTHAKQYEELTTTSEVVTRNRATARGSPTWGEGKVFDGEEVRRLELFGSVAEGLGRSNKSAQGDEVISRS